MKMERGLNEMMGERHALKQLMDSAGWAILMDIANGQLNSRGPTVLGPMPADRIYEIEFMKGEMAGIGLFQNMPENAIEGLRLEIQEERQRLGLEDEEDSDGNEYERTAP
jgi:hypothetical protein